MRTNSSNWLPTSKPVWEDPQTDVRLKKRLVRTLIREIVADVDPEAGNILLVIHWQGGVHTELSVQKRRCGQNRTHTAPDVVEAIRQLVLIGDDERIAGWLNQGPHPHGTRQPLDAWSRRVLSEQTPTSSFRRQMRRSRRTG